VGTINNFPCGLGSAHYHEPEQHYIFVSKLRAFEQEHQSQAAPYVIQEDYRSGALLLYGDVNGKPHVVIKQHLKHYIVGIFF
jgi:hypothetical protein